MSVVNVSVDGYLLPAAGNTTNATADVECTNDYCVSADDYLDMIRDYIFPTTLEWCVIALYLVVFIIGLFGNLLVCVAVCKNHHMRTVTNFFIVNLSVADFLVILICLPLTVLTDVTETWYLGGAMCKFAQYMQGVSVGVSVLTLTVISVERWYAICRPMRFRSTTTRARLVIVLIWLAAFLIMLPEVIVLDSHAPFAASFTVLLTSCKPRWHDDSQKAFQLCLIAVLFVVPLGLMAACYAHIATVLWRKQNPAEPCTIKTNGGRSCAESQLMVRRKAAKMLIAVVVIFVICYLPVHMLNIFRYARIISGRGSVHFALIAHWLCYFNSAVNPVIYNLMSAKFRKEFGAVCDCCAACRAPGERGAGVRRRTADGGTYAYRTQTSVTSQTEHFALTAVGPRAYKSSRYD